MREEDVDMEAQVYVGIAGWTYADWEGIVYTEKDMDKLEYVSTFVDCIELNNTFYRPPSAKNCASWLRRTAANPEFFFTAKLHKDFTHEEKVDAGTVKQFHEGFAPMLEAEKLRCLLIQFRYDFDDTDSNRQHLRRIVEAFKDAFNLAVEVRHKSWQAEDALDFLAKLGVTVCNLDYPLGNMSFDMYLCTVGRHGYFRLHGRNADKWFSKAGRDETYDYYYNEKELGQIHNRIEQLRKALESLTVIANNHYRGAELANAIELKALVSGQKQLVPRGLVKTYPKLAGIALNV